MLIGSRTYFELAHDGVDVLHLLLADARRQFHLRAAQVRARRAILRPLDRRRVGLNSIGVSFRGSPKRYVPARGAAPRPTDCCGS